MTTKKKKKTKKPGRRYTFSSVMQTRVPDHIRDAVLNDLQEMEAEGVYKSESDWIRESIISRLKDKKLL